MFKGYIPTRGKRPAESIKGRDEFYKFDEIKHLKSYGGVLSDDIVMVDFDDSDEANIMHKIVQDLDIKCNIIATSRGKHFYFKNSNLRKNCIHRSIAIGLHVDIKLGDRNAVVPLKIDGVEREFLQKVDDLDQLPRWVHVLNKNVDFNNLQEGDGRNQTLFNYILTLQSDGLSKDDIREVIGLINKYVMKEPLDEKELEIILRDEAFTKESFFKGSQLLHDRFARFIMNEENVIKINDTLNVYENGVYQAKSSKLESVMIKHIPILTKAKRSEVLSYLELICPSKRLTVDNSILVNNGILKIKTKELLSFDVDYICKNKIPVNYNPEAYHKPMDNTLNKISCNDKDLRLLMEEMIGYCLLRRNELGKCFILTGKGSNGKSTFLNIIKAFIGEENISSIALEELQHRFKTAELYGKLANIGDDISGNYIEDNAVLKKLVTGETVNVERKGKDPFDFDNYSKLIFSANNMPRINDTSDGLMRRIIIVPFNAKFSVKDKDFDPFIMDKLLSQEAMEYLLNLAIDGLQRVLTNRKFTTVESVEKELQEYERVNNPVVAFVEDFKIENEPTKEIYLKYSAWCQENKLKALSNVQFGKELSNKGFAVRQMRVNGERVRVYHKQVKE